jgi:hypothetical protein
MLYESINWPTVPTTIESTLITHVKSATDIWGRAHDGNGIDYAYSLFAMPAEAKAWFYQNLPITEDWKVHVQKISRYAHPHIDEKRVTAYNYVIAGAGATTNWHNPDGTIIESVQFEGNKWFKLDVSVLHSVSNVTDERIAITVYQIN